MSVKSYNNGPLPDALSERAYFSAHEFALPKADALRYLLWCKEQGHVIYGWEVWLPTTPGPTPLIIHCDGGFEHCYSALANADFSDENQKHGMEVVINPCVEERPKSE